MLTAEEVSEKYKKDVRKILYFDDNTTIVLFKHLYKISDPDNVCCLDKNGQIRWTIMPDFSNPEQHYVDIIISDGWLIAFNISTIKYTIDPQTGVVFHFIMTK